MNIPNLPLIDFNLVIKVIMLFFIGIYSIFVLVIYNNIRSLTKLLVIKRTLGSPLISFISILFLLSTISLFIAALVIL